MHLIVNTVVAAWKALHDRQESQNQFLSSNNNSFLFCFALPGKSVIFTSMKMFKCRCENITFPRCFSDVRPLSSSLPLWLIKSSFQPNRISGD